MDREFQIEEKGLETIIRVPFKNSEKDAALIDLRLSAAYAAYNKTLARRGLQNSNFHREIIAGSMPDGTVIIVHHMKPYN